MRGQCRASFSRRIVLALWATVGVGSFFTSSAEALDYSYTTIIDNAGPHTQFHVDSARPLNDIGEVALFATMSTIGSGDIYKGSGHGTGLTLISTDSSHFVDSASSGSINDGGSVVFAGGPAFFQHLLSGSGGGLTTVVAQGGLDPDPYWVLRGTATINDADAVAFRGGRKNPAGFPPGTVIDGYYTVSGGSVSAIVEVGSTYSSVSDVAPDFNDAGQAVFVATAVADETRHILRYDGPGITTVATGFTGDTRVSLNSAGDVAFADAASVKLFQNGVTTTIADTSHGFSAFLRSGEGRALVNDSGQLAFLGDVDSYQGNPVTWDGVYTGNDVVNDRVLVRGDVVLGHIVDFVDLLGLNNAGQLLMRVEGQSPDPWRALIVATPVIPGDYNNDGAVDAADYTIWRDDLGASVTLPNDTTAGTVTQEDYDVWRANFGAVASPGTLQAGQVPEPASIFLVAILLSPVLQTRRRVAD